MLRSLASTFKNKMSSIYLNITLVVVATLAVSCSLHLGKSLYLVSISPQLTGGELGSLNHLDKRGDIEMDKCQSNHGNPKVILLWEEELWTDPYRGVDVFENCTYNRCCLTRDRKRVAEADLVVFSEECTLPSVRPRGQLYLHLADNPVLNPKCLDKYNDLINITMSYRADADISFTPAYYRQRTQPLQGPYKSYDSSWIGKKNPIVWPVSNCHANSSREQYVDQLSKYIDVHVAGKCGNYRCSKYSERWQRCYEHWHIHYKFYLSFEQAVCEDYVTQQLYRPLQYDLVPVVLGGTDYPRAAPPHSVINVRDFTSPRHLADYLLTLSANRTLYYDYLQWKQRYEIVTDTSEFCLLCEAVHSDKFKDKPAYHDYRGWYEKGCNMDLLQELRKRAGW